MRTRGIKYVGLTFISLGLCALWLCCYKLGGAQNEEVRTEKSEGGEKMRIGIIISSNDPETVWNAFRLGNFALKKGDGVSVFLISKGVEAESLDTDAFKVTEQIHSLLDNGGEILACGTCLKMRHWDGSKACPLSTMEDLYKIVKESDKVITF